MLPGRPIKPVTLQDLEECLDILADIISRSGDDGELAYPIWRRLDKEMEVLEERDRIKAAVRERSHSASWIAVRRR